MIYKSILRVLEILEKCWFWNCASLQLSAFIFDENCNPFNHFKLFLFLFSFIKCFKVIREFPFWNIISALVFLLGSHPSQVPRTLVRVPNLYFGSIQYSWGTWLLKHPSTPFKQPSKSSLFFAQKIDEKINK